MKISCVYQIRNIINNKIYIGSTINLKSRINEHKNDLKKNIHSNQYLQNAWNKYGQQSFVFEILIIEENDWKGLEQYYIDLLKPDYNIAKNVFASFLGRQHTEETKKKIGRKGRKHHFFGKKHSENTKKQISESGFNREPCTLETRNKLSKSSSGENNGMFGIRGEQHPRHGKKHSAESKAKMSQTRKNNKKKKCQAPPQTGI